MTKPSDLSRQFGDPLFLQSGIVPAHVQLAVYEHESITVYDRHRRVLAVAGWRLAYPEPEAIGDELVDRSSRPGEEQPAIRISSEPFGVETEHLCRVMLGVDSKRNQQHHIARI